MPRNLFEPPLPAAHRRGTSLSIGLSVAAHVVVMGGAAVFTVVATDALPPVDRRITNIVLPPPAPAPPPPPVVRRVPAVSPDSTAAGAAPVGTIPDGIAPEADRRANAGGVEGADGGVVGGVDTGVPGSILSATLEAPVTQPPPPPVRTTPVRVGGKIAAPLRLQYVAPVYPPIAQSARVQGVVVLDAVIDAHGHVTSVVLTRSIPLLDEAAIAAVQQWRYRPTLLNGVPVPVLLTVQVRFTLR